MRKSLKKFQFFELIEPFISLAGNYLYPLFVLRLLAPSSDHTRYTPQHIPRTSSFSCPYNYLPYDLRVDQKRCSNIRITHSCNFMQCDDCMSDLRRNPPPSIPLFVWHGSSLSLLFGMGMNEYEHNDIAYFCRSRVQIRLRRHEYKFSDLLQSFYRK